MASPGVLQHRSSGAMWPWWKPCFVIRDPVPCLCQWVDEHVATKCHTFDILFPEPACRPKSSWCRWNCHTECSFCTNWMSGLVSYFWMLMSSGSLFVYSWWATCSAPVTFWVPLGWRSSPLETSMLKPGENCQLPEISAKAWKA